MSELTLQQQRTIQQTIHDVSHFLHGELRDDPEYTGNIDIHLRDGVALGIDLKRKHKLIK